eukprot:9932738-Alexandrium_andersonii.AAC.1
MENDLWATVRRCATAACWAIDCSLRRRLRHPDEHSLRASTLHARQANAQNSLPRTSTLHNSRCPAHPGVPVVLWRGERPRAVPHE